MGFLLWLQSPLELGDSNCTARTIKEIEKRSGALQMGPLHACPSEWLFSQLPVFAVPLAAAPGCWCPRGGLCREHWRGQLCWDPPPAGLSCRWAPCSTLTSSCHQPDGPQVSVFQLVPHLTPPRASTAELMAPTLSQSSVKEHKPASL